MDVFRLIDGGKPDRIIAFDSLPESLTQGIEMFPPSGLPREWGVFLGKKRKITLDAFKQNRRYVEEGPFFYSLSYKDINSDIEKWQEIVSYVKRNVPQNFRLLDRLEDMALPMAVDCKSPLDLEVEHVREKALIPLNKEAVPYVKDPMAPVMIVEELPDPVRKPDAKVQESFDPVKEEAEKLNANVKAEHSCEGKGRGGRYAPKGECKRCDQLTEAKAVAA